MVFLRSLLTLFCTFALVAGTDFSKEIVERVNVEEFSKNSKEGHVMPPSSFFLPQLNNMCSNFEHESLAFYICSHLREGQKYVVPILDFHGEDSAHVFMVELVPQKVYYHADSPIALTSATGRDHEMQVLVPKQHVPAKRLQSLAEELARTAR